MSSVSDFTMFRFNFWQKPFFSHHAAVLAASQVNGMENSAYVPNPLTSPALMVLASTAEGHEAGRMTGPHHPYSTQSVDGKDIPSPYGNPPFTMYRPGDPFPPPMYTGVPPFIRPDRGMGSIMPQCGAFRPVSTEAEATYHSAFGPAAKKAKHDSSLSTVEDRDESLQSQGSSTPQVKEERPSSLSSAANSESFSDGGEFDRGTPEEGRSLRKQRKKCVLDGQTPCCPVCGLTLRNGEMESHLALELDRLDKIVRCGRRSRDTTPQSRKSLSSPTYRQRKDSPSIEAASQSRYDTYVRIKCNRQSRLSARSRNKKKRPDESICPVCNDRLYGCPEDLNAHVEMCLKRRSEEEEPVDVEGDEQGEEYTWAGQTRIRATTLLQGGFAGSGFQIYSSKQNVEEDVDLNVDGDDSEQYGPPQFNEVDIIPCSSEEPGEDRERAALRGAMLGSTSNIPENLSATSSKLPHSTVNNHTADTAPVFAVDSGRENLICTINQDSDNESPDEGEEGSTNLQGINENGSSTEIIAALKARLRDQEKYIRKEKSKCLICMESYTNPLTSIQCWHVHCEECWLKTLGAKKLCPQCNMITAARDLRRIYL